MLDTAGLEAWQFSLLVGAGSLLAGFLGALTGLGGGVVIVPMLTLLFGVDIRYAVGASLLSVIATSSGAAAAYVREGYSNIRLGMFLEMATTAGALSGAMLALGADANAIAIVFGLVLLFSAYFSLRDQRGEQAERPSGGLARWLALDSMYPTPGGLKAYSVHAVPAGFALMYVAGVLSGLLGIGSGAVKVLALDRAMRVPFKVSTTTSNFMIGVTAAASAGIYLHRGYLNPTLAMPVVLGVLVGATVGSRLLAGGPVKLLRLMFAIVVSALAVQMIVHALQGGFSRGV